MRHKKYESKWNLFFGKKIYGNFFWWKKIFKGHCCQREYRGPTIEKKIYFGENILSLIFVFLNENLIRLVSFINGCTNQFSYEMVLSGKKTFQGHCCQWEYRNLNYLWNAPFMKKCFAGKLLSVGVQKPKDRKQN